MPEDKTCWTCGYKSGSGHILVGGCNWHQAHGKHDGPKPFPVEPSNLKACIVDRGCGQHTTEKWTPFKEGDIVVGIASLSGKEVVGKFIDKDLGTKSVIIHTDDGQYVVAMLVGLRHTSEAK